MYLVAGISGAESGPLEKTAKYFICLCGTNHSITGIKFPSPYSAASLSDLERVELFLVSISYHLYLV